MLEQKSGHWQHFAAQSTPGAGFDTDFAAVNGGGPSFIKRIIRDTIMRARGTDLDRHAKAFSSIWPDGPISLPAVKRAGGTPIAFLGAHFANTVLTALPPTLICHPPTYLEIGAGSGYLTYFLLSQDQMSRAVIIDLPEVGELGRQNLERLGVADRIKFLTPDQAETVDTFNVALNTASMQEMLPETIAAYFEFLRRKRAAHQSAFYCCNRIEKFLSTEPGNSDVPGARRDISVRFDEYPWGKEETVIDRRSVIHDLLGMQPCHERMIEL